MKTSQPAHILVVCTSGVGPAGPFVRRVEGVLQEYLVETSSSVEDAQDAIRNQDFRAIVVLFAKDWNSGVVRRILNVVRERREYHQVPLGLVMIGFGNERKDGSVADVGVLTRPGDCISIRPSLIDGCYKNWAGLLHKAVYEQIQADA